MVKLAFKVICKLEKHVNKVKILDDFKNHLVFKLKFSWLFFYVKAPVALLIWDCKPFKRTSCLIITS